MDIIDFVTESNRIEGIIRTPRQAEIDEMHRFIRQPEIKIVDLVLFVSIYQPDAVLRDREDLNVRVGKHTAPRGGPNIVPALQAILKSPGDPYQQHCAYETLHPFTDGNGRSGRALWLWSMGGNAPLGFLHQFYYQTLAGTR